MYALHDIPLFAEGWEIAVLRLLAAFVAGALLGMERERRERPAGLRTHALVSLTACLSMVAVAAAGGDPSSPGRVAAGVLTGIGFLGAGTIMRHGSVVRGLTTAASIWAAAAIGVTIGLGWYLGTVVALVLAVLTLTLLRAVERPLRREPGLLHIEATLAPGTVFPEGLCPRLVENSVEVYDFDVEPGEPSLVRLALEPGGHLSATAVVALVQSAPGIAAARLVGRSKRRG